jgi:hypothetical protein
VFDLGFWLTFVAAVPAGVGGALLGSQAVDRLLANRRPRAEEPGERPAAQPQRISGPR